MRKSALVASTALIGFALVSAVNAGEREAMMRAFSANQAMLERFTKESDAAGADEKERARRFQKISVLADANRKIVLELLKERHEEGDRSPRGERWLHMMPQDKESYVFSAVSVLEEKWGVIPTKPSIRYAKAMDETLAADPSWQQRPLSNLLYYTLVRSEPEALEKLKALAFGNGSSEVIK